MNPAAIRAAKSSAISNPSPPIRAMEIPIKAAMEVLASLLWWKASALTAELLISSPVLRTNLYKSSLARTTTTKTISVKGAGLLWGSMIWRILSWTIIPAAQALDQGQNSACHDSYKRGFQSLSGQFVRVPVPLTVIQTPHNFRKVRKSRHLVDIPRRPPNGRNISNRQDRSRARPLRVHSAVYCCLL